MPEEGQILTHILTLKDQVLKWATPKSHMTKEATTSELGHVKVDTSVTNGSNNPVKSSGIVNYVTSQITKYNVKESITKNK